MLLETRVRELIDQLPAYTDSLGQVFNIKYDHGTKDVFNKYLNENDEFPLVWLVPSPYSENNRSKIIKADVRFFIAIQSDKVDEFNTVIFETDYKTCLEPIKDNLIKALDKSTISSIEDDIRVSNEPNYSFKKDEKGATVSTLNVIVIDATITINNNCLKTINF
tara:strand:- start:19072 stop:19563 length:492 start_codon:yes stop_codon:yes gene_type:complete